MENSNPQIVINAERLEQVLRIVAAVTLGDYEVRIPDLADASDDTFLELEVALNMLLDELQQARQRNSQQSQELQLQAEQLRQQQKELVSALSTPIVVVASGVLALPIIGAVELERAQLMTEAMLQRVVHERATHVILDLTGAGEIAEGTAQSLLRMAKTLRLLGSRCFITGLSPAMARTLVALEFSSSHITTLPQLADALTAVFHDKALMAQNKPGIRAR